MSDRTYTESEVNAKCAAILERAAKHRPCNYVSGESIVGAYCAAPDCEWDSTKTTQTWEQHIRALIPNSWHHSWEEMKKLRDAANRAIADLRAEYRMRLEVASFPGINDRAYVFQASKLDALFAALRAAADPGVKK